MEIVIMPAALASMNSMVAPVWGIWVAKKDPAACGLPGLGF